MMRFKTWWRDQSRQAKFTTVLATILLLDIGLCFGTPTTLGWFIAVFHIQNTDPFWVLD